jgi:glycosyltransferase involved in cell wall biosynthesis
VATPGADVAADAAQLKLVFVGSLIATKGLDLLIAAVDAARAGGAAVTLDVFGPGDPTAYAFREGVTRYCGRIPFGETQTVVSGYDALVLPSRYDGWGVVVNEALCAGVPVICSDRVGAGVLVEKFGAGAIFDGARDEALRDLLVALAQHRERIRDMRQHTADAASAIQPEVAAAYLLSVIRAPRDAKARVPSPWYGGSP